MSNLLNQIVGRELSAIVFVRDYIQLQFDGPVLSFFDFPTVQFHGQELVFGDQDYRNKICELIDTTVRTVTGTENEVSIRFDAENSIFLLIDREKIDIPEVAMFQANNGETVVW